MEMLGGRRREQYDDGGFLVMADPEGNEFCVIPEGAFELMARDARTTSADRLRGTATQLPQRVYLTRLGSMARKPKRLGSLPNDSF